jgi:hypothetical protein
MNDELDRIWKGAVVAQYKCYPHICIVDGEKQRKSLVRIAGVPT